MTQDQDRVLVTGGSGFIGTNLVEHLLQRGYDVLNVDKGRPRSYTQEAYWAPGDITDPPSFYSAAARFAPTYVVHLAARTDLRGARLSDYAANTTGVETVLDYVQSEASVKRVLFASSRLVCGVRTPPESAFDYSPPNAYGRSKVVGEQMVRAADIRPAWAIVRPTSIWGPWFGTPYKEFFLAVGNGRYVHPGRRDVSKSFGFVGNTVRQLAALLEAREMSIAGRTFYLADTEPTSVLTLANEIRRQLGKRPVRAAPSALLRAAALLGDLAARTHLMQNPPLTSFRLSNLKANMIFDMNPLSEVVGCVEDELSASVATTLLFLRSRGEFRAASPAILP